MTGVRGSRNLFDMRYGDRLVGTCAISANFQMGGSPRKDRAMKKKTETDDFVLPKAPPECLDGMKNGQAHWRHIRECAEQLDLGMSDLDTIITACMWWEQFQNSMDQLRQEGAVITHGNGTRGMNPAVMAAKRASTEWRACASRLGLDPESRRKRKISASRPRRDPVGVDNRPGARFAR